jgi:hypothetical protein
VRLFRAAGAVLLFVVSITVFTAAGGRPASAAPVLDLSCSKLGICPPGYNVKAPAPAAPTPGYPGSGLAGSFDPHPSSGTTLYDQYGYSPLQWQLYDEGTALNPSNLEPDTSATIDNTVGGWVFGSAVWIVAAGDGISKMVDPPVFLGAFNHLISNATAAFDNAFWKQQSSPRVPSLAELALLVVGVMIVIRARKKNFAAALGSAGWALGVIGLVAYVTLFSVQVGTSSDKLLSSTIDSIYAQVDGTGQANNGAGGSLEVSKILYPLWCEGVLGSSTSEVAVKECPLLYAANGYSWAETDNGTKSPSAAVIKAKAAEWQKAAAVVHATDPSAYAHMTDHSGGRIGAGFFALFAALLTTGFRIVADLLVVASLLMIRLAVIVVPVVGVLAVNEKFASVLRNLIGAVGSALISAVVFSAAAALNILVVGIFLTPAFPMWFGVLCCAVFAWLLWRYLKPYRKLTALTGAIVAQGARTVHQHRREERRDAGRAAQVARAVAGAVGGPEAAVAVDAAAGHVANRDEGAPSPWVTEVPPHEEEVDVPREAVDDNPLAPGAPVVMPEAVPSEEVGVA